MNLTKGEMVFRILVGVLLIVVTLIPSLVGRWILWVLAAVLVITGITKHCPLCKAIDKEPVGNIPQS